MLVGLAQIERLGLLAILPGYTFAVTPEVLSEIIDVDLKQRVEVALSAGIVRLEELSGDAQIALFAKLRQPMGAGEAASLALAIHNGWAIASDDQKAFRHEASTRLGQGRILTTSGLYSLAVRAGALSGADAEAEMQTIASLRSSARILW